MNLLELKQLARKTYPILRLERFVPRRSRRPYRKLALLLTLAGLVGFIWYIQLLGLALIGLAFWLKLALIDAFYYAQYFRGLDPVLSLEGEISPAEKIGWSAAVMVHNMRERDATAGFITSLHGQAMVWRAGIALDQIKSFITQRKNLIKLSDCCVETTNNYERYSMVDIARSVYKVDKEFARFLFQYGIQEQEFIAVAEWVMRNYRRAKLRERWWGRDALGRVPGIGRDWSYGQAFALERYERPLPSLAYGLGDKYYSQDTLSQVEAILAKAREANVVLVGDDEAEKLDLLVSLMRALERGEVLAPLKSKRVAFFDTQLFIASNDHKGEFERELIRVLNSAEAAGNVVLVIPDLAALARSAEVLGINLFSLIDPHLNSSFLQVIALTNSGEFNNFLSGQVVIKSRF